MELFEERYQKLNVEQKRAVDALDGPVMVIAGPGSGKTEVLGLRVANIVRSRDVGPGSILCLTFTDAAASTMRQRLAGLLGTLAYRVGVHTFHSFGTEVISRYPERFYNGASFAPADTVVQIEVLEEIVSNLEHGNPLRAEHEGRFIHLQKTLSAIEYLKKAGLTPADFKTILEANKKALAFIDPIVGEVFSERISKKVFPEARKAAQEMEKYSADPLPGSFPSLPECFRMSLAIALDNAEREGKTGPLTDWKAVYLERGDDGLAHAADLGAMEKLEALAAVYGSYIERMREASYYDYNDMILDTIAALDQDLGLRRDLQERYRYILVDEFQDTNNAQMRLLRLLTDDPADDGRPNIMVVGDDDQAVFKFQGAELSNIRDFARSYRDPAFVVLTENYRSIQSILDGARRVIAQGVSRLENTMPELVKELRAARSDLGEGSVRKKEFLSREAECKWIVDEVRTLQEKSVPVGEIAVVAREHRHLEALAPYFHSAAIPISYERQENVLDQPHIKQLIAMARFADSVMRKSKDADDLLPEILSYHFWGLERSAVWELSIKAGEARKPWLMVMRESGGALKQIADFFMELGAKAAYATAEEVLHDLMEGPGGALVDSFRSHYFGLERFNDRRAEYLRFLSSLRSFMRTVREYRTGRPVAVADMLACVDMHRKNGIAMQHTGAFTNGEDAVRLLTAHKAKGLEFEAVFVIHCENDVWANDRGSRGLRLPVNLPVGPAGDTRDDQLRLFYVAMTRAKRFLCFTSSLRDYRGRAVDPLGFLAPSEGEPAWFESEAAAGVEARDALPEALLEERWNLDSVAPFTHNERALLKPVLERYQLSVTHLQNFLNVADAGPGVFLEKNLLRFPEPKTPSAAFGSAMHSTIRRAYLELQRTGALAPVASVEGWFKEYLEAERLNRRDFERMAKRGEKTAPAFYEERKGSFSASDIIEFNFRDQGVRVGDASLTGKVDRMSIKKKEIIVCDFKTGKPIRAWSPADSYAKVKAWRYRQQIVFYKLLIEGSREFGGKYSVERGFIEFVEPYRGHVIVLPMDIEGAEVKRLETLIGIVYAKIQSLDFPDISRYPKDVRGITAFEDDLLGGTI